MRRFLILGTVLFLASVVAHAQKPDTSVPDAPRVAAYLTHAAPASTLEQAAVLNGMAQAVTPADSISLYTVVDLALRNSKPVLISEAAQRRARGVWAETRHVYIPNFSLGSGLGYSYGFPLGTPTVFNATSTSLLFSFSQRDYIRSAKAAFKAATLSLKDTRQKVILDASQTYIELNADQAELSALNQASSDAGNLVSIMKDRQQAGLESDLGVTNVELTQAEIQLRAIRLGNHADELRQHLSNLTGLAAGLLTPSESTIPKLPNLEFPNLMQTSDHAPSVQAAEATATSRLFSYWGDQRQNYRPTVQFAAQYALFSTFNNYQNYYNNKYFQQNNFGIGIQAVWPVFDPLRHDRAAESKAEAERARHEAELARIQNNEADLAMVHSLRELEAQARVAQLQQQVAKETLASTITQMNQGSAGASAPPVSPQQAQEGRIQERTTYVDLQDANFNVIKLKLELLNAMGGLEDWVKQGSASPTPSKK